MRCVNVWFGNLNKLKVAKTFENEYAKTYSREFKLLIQKYWTGWLGGKGKPQMG